MDARFGRKIILPERAELDSATKSVARSFCKETLEYAIVLSFHDFLRIV